MPTVPANRGPITLLLDLFSSVWTGICLLIVLFIYSSIGSAGLWLPASFNIFDFPGGWLQLHIRQYRGFEMTEFEWFNWWPFTTLIALICTNMVVVTLRRIPFKPINYGVWMIHTGNIVLALGSVWYFSAKIEGQATVLRRAIVINVPGSEPVRMPAIPGNIKTIEIDDRSITFQIRSINPQWPILSGADAGKKAYAVNVAVQDGQDIFVRQLLAGYPQYTEDIIRTDDPNQPMARAIKVLGKKLVNEDIEITFEYEPQKYFDLESTWAIYLREEGEPEWTQRPIEDMPRYNDYFSDRADVWLPREMASARPHTLDLPVPSIDGDLFSDINIRITSYLRYAQMQQRRVPGGDRIDPEVFIRIDAPDGRMVEHQLVAFDPSLNQVEGGLLHFRWITSQQQLEEMAAISFPKLEINVVDSDVSLIEEIKTTSTRNPALEFTQIQGTDYSYRVQFIQNNMPIKGHGMVSMVSIEIRKSDITFKRWVFDNPSLNRDMPSEADPIIGHDQEMALDENINIKYVQGNAPPSLTLIAGPNENDLQLMLSPPGEKPRFEQVEVGKPVQIGLGATLSVLRYSARTTFEVKPAIIPQSQRQRDVRERLSMVRAEITYKGATQSLWLPFHVHVFDSEDEILLRYNFKPTIVHLSDGRHFEFIFGRERMELTAPVVLDDFVMETHVGGYTGQTTTVLNWTSMIRFLEDDSNWGKTIPVSVNSPQAYDGFSYFQAAWDPPEPQSGYGGMNYTVLGVGNRHGVNVMLFGTCLSVIGMIYAFYIKPMIKRRRQKAVYAQVIAEKISDEVVLNSQTVDMQEEPVIIMGSNSHD